MTWEQRHFRTSFTISPSLTSEVYYKFVWKFLMRFSVTDKYNFISIFFLLFPFPSESWPYAENFNELALLDEKLIIFVSKFFLECFGIFPKKGRSFSIFFCRLRSLRVHQFTNRLAVKVFKIEFKTTQNQGS